MILALRVLTALFVVLLFALGLRAFVDPVTMLAEDAFAWSPDGVAGLSAGRAVLGGHFLGFGLVAVYAFVKSQYELLYVLAVGESMIVIGRLISLVVDGSDPRVLTPLGVEVVLATVMFAAARFLPPRPA